MTNYISPYMNPYNQTYGQQYQGLQQPIQQQQVVKVNGENGARAYQMGPNSSALLLDESGAIVWLKTTDGASYATVTPYDITPHKVATSQDYLSLENRISKLEEIINATNSTDSQPVKRKNISKPVSADVAND